MPAAAAVQVASVLVQCPSVSAHVYELWLVVTGILV